MKNMRKDGTFKDVSANSADAQRDELLNYCNNNGIDVKSKIHYHTGNAIVAAIKNGEKIFVGCRQVGKKKTKAYERTLKSKEDEFKWRQLL